MVDPLWDKLFNPFRPLRFFAPLFTLAAIGFALATPVVGYSAAVHERSVVARGQDGSLSLPPARRAYALTLYGATAGGGSSPDRDCQLAPSSRGRVGNVLNGTGSTFELEGKKLYRLGVVIGAWDPGDVVSCDGVEQIVAVTESRMEKVWITVACAVMAALALLFSRIGYRSRRTVDERVGDCR